MLRRTGGAGVRVLATIGGPGELCRAGWRRSRTIAHTPIAGPIDNGTKA